MKITCSQNEFKELVESCLLSRAELSSDIPTACVGCAFCALCSKGGDMTKDSDIMSCISDVCEIEVN